MHLNVRIIFIYILSFCLILFGGYRYAHGGTTHNPAGYTSAKHIEKAQQVKFVNTGQDLTLVNTTLSADDKFSIFSIEEDDDIVFSRKYVLLENFFITLAYASFLICFYSFFKNSLRFRTRLLATRLCTYLLQGALRI